MRHTVRVAGAVELPDEEDDVGVELLLELLQPAMSAAAAPTATSAAGVFLSPTDGTPSGVVNSAIKLIV